MGKVINKLRKVWYKSEAGSWQDFVDKHTRRLGYAKNELKDKQTPPWKKRELRMRIEDIKDTIEYGKERVRWYKKLSRVT